MKHNWSEAELNAFWMFDHSEHSLIDQRTDHSRLGFAVLLKFFQLEGYFPERHKSVPKIAVAFIAEQLDIPANVWHEFSFSDRTAKRVRAQIRGHLGFRPATVKDGELIQQWLLQAIVPKDQDTGNLRRSVLDWCKSHQVEPPSKERIERLIAAAVHTFETTFFSSVAGQLSSATVSSFEQLLEASSTEMDGDIADANPDHPTAPFSVLKSDPGRVSLKSLEKEVTKLDILNTLDLPGNLFTGTAPKILRRYRLRAATESVWQLRRHPEPIRYSLLAVFCWQRRQEILDGLVDLLIQIIHKLSVKAEKRIYQELVGELEKVDGKTTLLYRLAEAAVGEPEGIVKDVLFPVVGESTLEALVKGLSEP